MEHIDDQTLELYLLEAREVDAQRAEIKAHLKECAGCAALYEKMADYYRDVQQIKDGRARERSQALTVRNMIVRIPPFSGRPSIEIPKTVPARVILFVIRHPIASSLSFLSLLLVALFFLLPKAEKKDLNLSYARAKGEFLIAYNKSGEELWKKHVGLGYLGVELNPEQYLASVDVDGDKQNELLAIFFGGRAFLSPLEDAVVCYNADGSERWKYEVHRQVMVGEETFSDDYKVTRMMVGDFDRDGNYEVVIIARHNTLWPCAIIRLDARSGALTNEYWHAGWLTFAGHKDIDGHNIEELFFAGENNAFNSAALLVLDPRNMEGQGPATHEYVPRGAQAGTEKYYVTMPPSDLGKLSEQPRNQAGTMTFLSDRLEVACIERVQGVSYGINFYFNDAMKCIKALPIDDFIVFHRRMEAEGKLTKKIDEQYSEDLRRGVRYWDGEKFIPEPTINKRYLEVIQKKMLP